MKIIAFDSTAKAASAAVSEDGRLLALYTVDNGLTQSELLLPMAESVLHSLRLTFDDIDLFTCCVGPGSFTGVRIGASLVKGLAFGKDVPCIGVSSLEALARNMICSDGLICPVMDARRNQLYNALFSCKNGTLTRLTEDRLLTAAELKAELDQYSDTVYFVGDGCDIANNLVRVVVGH